MTRNVLRKDIDDIGRRHTRLNTAKDKLSRYMDAGFPILMYKTYDEMRALDVLAEVNDGRRVLEWSELGYFDTNGSEFPSLSIQDFLANIASAGSYELNDTIVILRDLRQYMDNSSVINLLKHLAQMIAIGDIGDCTIILLGEHIDLPIDLEPFVTIIEEDVVQASEIDQQITKFCESYDITIDIKLKDSLVTAFRGLSKYEIEHILALSYADDGEITTNDIGLVIEQKKQIVKKSGVLEMIPLEESMDSIGGLSVLKEWIQNKSKVFSNIDSAKSFGVDVPKGVLIAGIPGCGKSLSAKATAKLFNSPLLRLDMGRIMGKYVGESEANMRKAIRIAEDISPCVLWIDEIEKAFSGVNGGSSATDITNRLLGSFLTWLQEKKSQVFVVMTANDATKLPPELVRKGRLDEVFFVELPDTKERKEILKIHLYKRRPQDVYAIDLDQIARNTEGYSGADIEGIVKDAIEHAFTNNKSSVSTSDIMNAINHTHSLKVIMSQSIDEMIKMYKDKKFKNASK